jgi:hypothetical protein
MFCCALVGLHTCDSSSSKPLKAVNPFSANVKSNDSMAASAVSDVVVGCGGQVCACDGCPISAIATPECSSVCTFDTESDNLGVKQAGAPHRSPLPAASERDVVLATHLFHRAAR